MRCQLTVFHSIHSPVGKDKSALISREKLIFSIFAVIVMYNTMQKSAVLESCRSLLINGSNLFQCDCCNFSWISSSILILQKIFDYTFCPSFKDLQNETALKNIKLL